MTTIPMTPERLTPGDAVLIDGNRACRVCVPGPPFVCRGGGTVWLPGVVEVARADGWVVAMLAPRRELHRWDRRVVVPPDAVHPCTTPAA